MTNHTLLKFHRNGFFFRIRGYGLSIDFNSPIFFSERLRYRTPLLRIGKLAIWVRTPSE